MCGGAGSGFLGQGTGWELSSIYGHELLWVPEQTKGCGCTRIGILGFGLGWLDGGERMVFAGEGSGTGVRVWGFRGIWLAGACGSTVFGGLRGWG